ncbi:hypothetical protein L195_g051123 [Trifolium pratense]|uniref:Uncharacterized protein n=2 Tax=Trifolium pratense TaxID=57577 RepID=A0ACB0JCT0_TRIPR|nr:hypothetical protein L195_g051123 [Trifolium pratense]CAJ2641758.1 unnamed protein product [Trifolium pratense]
MEPPNIVSSVLSDRYHTHHVWIPSIIPPPEPPDRISTSLSPPIIHCAAIEKSTQVEFTSCTTIIDFHLIHNFKVTTYVINSCAFLPLSAIFNLAVSDIVTITLSIATIQCHDRYSFTMLLTVLQLFDEMPKCLVAVCNAIGSRLNFQDFIVEECDGHCLENCTTRLGHTTQIVVNLSNPTLKHHEDKVFCYPQDLKTHPLWL